MKDERILREAGKVLDDITYVDKLLSNKAKTSPEHKEALDSNFTKFIRTPFITSDMLYKKHCKELMQRILTGKDLSSATKAETLGAMSIVSSQTKMNQKGINVVIKLLDELEINEESVLQLKEMFREDYKGSTDSDIQDCIKHLSYR